MLTVGFACIGAFKEALATPPDARGQLNTFDALLGSQNYNETSALIRQAGLNQARSEAVQVAVNFERSNWATASVRNDTFYTLPGNASQALPGDILRVEQTTNTTKFTLPPNVALSRFLYQSESLNSSSVPASAFVLWPWAARKFDNITGYPVVVWAHGTSGTTPDCAPSHIRNLWYQYSAPFTLALQGYVVIGVDYAGLGPSKTYTDDTVVHQWGANPAGANDVFYAVEAAQKAWPELSTEFVVMGHSQGGGVAWASAQRQVSSPVNGYLGSIAGSPVTGFKSRAYSSPAAADSFVTFIAPTIASVFPEFNPSNWLTDTGLKYLALFEALNGCQSTRTELFSDPDSQLAQPGWNESWYFSQFNQLISTEGKPIVGPLLVLQGTADDSVSVVDTTEAVNETCTGFGNVSIRYELFEGATHVPTLFASEQTWLDWIAARFNRARPEPSCTRQIHRPIRPVEAYEAQVNYFLEVPIYAYETA